MPKHPSSACNQHLPNEPARNRMNMKSPLPATRAHLKPDGMGPGRSLLSRARRLAAGALTGLLVCGVPNGPALAQPSDQIEAQVAPVGALDKIIEAGIVRIAVPSDLPPFGSRSPSSQLE